jgi:hypothetical protein
MLKANEATFVDNKELRDEWWSMLDKGVIVWVQ